MTIVVGERTFDIEITEDHSNFKAILDGKSVNLKPEWDKFGQLSAIIVDGIRYEVRLNQEKDKYKVNVFRNPFSVSVIQAIEKTEEKAETQETQKKILVTSPMSGLVIIMHIKLGLVIESGASLLVLEAMKMQNEIKSPIKAKVSEVFVSVGQTVEKDDKLLTLEPV